MEGFGATDAYAIGKLDADIAFEGMRRLTPGSALVVRRRNVSPCTNCSTATEGSLPMPAATILTKAGTDSSA